MPSASSTSPLSPGPSSSAMPAAGVRRRHSRGRDDSSPKAKGESDGQVPSLLEDPKSPGWQAGSTAQLSRHARSQRGPRMRSAQQGGIPAVVPCGRAKDGQASGQRHLDDTRLRERVETGFRPRRDPLGGREVWRRSSAQSDQDKGKREWACPQYAPSPGGEEQAARRGKARRGASKPGLRRGDEPDAVAGGPTRGGASTRALRTKKGSR